MGSTGQNGLDNLGDVTAKVALANASLGLVFSGIQLAMVMYCVTVFAETPKSLRKGRLPYIILSIVIVAAFVVASSLNAYYLFYYLSRKRMSNGVFAKPSILSMQDHSSFVAKTTSSYVNTAYIWICDGLLLYRCRIIWRQHRWICALPLIAYLSSVALGILSLASYFSLQTQRLRDQASAASVLSSVSFNILATTLIVLKLLWEDQRLNSALSYALKTTAFSKIITLLIESALPAAFFGLIYGISILIPVPLPPPEGDGTVEQRAASVALVKTSYTLFSSFVALSPQLIILRVTTGRSWTNTRMYRGYASTFPSRPVSSTVVSDQQHESHKSVIPLPQVPMSDQRKSR
ncbi:hypothetical protein FA15DRAFT_756389 [Coprinopsis marcescibilis]|uniref:Uncharacterized protein n=1 Tax=Coprinopsis marcescibilis TaxID=230819 RepID=A0A5C3KW02_COPMA|nr:hypothetical protein FA15DRAFT_756389 [Coprinopsis marcescibilis]